MRACLAYLWYEVVYWFTFFGLMLCFSIRVRGRHNVPLKGPVLIIANHQSYIDPTMCGLCAPRHVFFLARKTLWKSRLLGAFLSSLNSVPVDQEGVGKEGLKTILQQMQAGHAVVVFPEGERTPDGIMHKLKPGITLLIKRVQAQIVPMGIAGGTDAWPRWQKFPRFAPLFLPVTRHTIAVSVGAPLDTRRYAAMSRDEALAQLFKEIQVQMEKAEQFRRK